MVVCSRRKESRYKVGRETRNSVLKWEGAALLINTLVSGAQNYTIMERWRLSASHALLTVTRQVVRAGGEAEGVLVYRRAGADVSEAPAARREPVAPRPASATEPAPILIPRPAPLPSVRGELTVPAGTRVLLELTHSLNTSGRRMETACRCGSRSRCRWKIELRFHGRHGARHSDRGERRKGKGDLYIRFDTLMLSDGTTRDLRGGRKEARARSPAHPIVRARLGK